ncbi:hypothetical protein Nepgr_022479 [Nepenthes gracilis]|uniref:Auxin transport protein BIG n=1 Tax=Nepenthes gracilis TaxID=150966 RepID=A0AAD3XX20_NEPGR|nr:hypothetical protein Nepgr_022479 [Nepenthes gracilis]
MAELAQLFEAVSQDKPSPSDLSLRLRSEPVKLGLMQFYSILKIGVEAIGDDDKLGLQSWNQSQIRSVCSIAVALASATRYLAVEQMEPIVVATSYLSVEFALCCLEKFDINSDDLSVQNNIVQLLETALVGGMDSESGSSVLCSMDSLVDILTLVTSKFAGFQLESHMKCNIRGVSCLSEERPVEQLLATLAYKCTQLDGQNSQSLGPFLYHGFNELVSLSQHWAVVHLGCFHRFLSFSRRLIEIPEMFNEKMADLSFHRKLSLCLRVLKLLKNLIRSFPFVELDSLLLQSVASFADAVPGLFQLAFEFVSSHSVAEISHESLVLMVLEEFLQLGQLIIYDKSIFLNVRVCIVASILGYLDPKIWKYNKSAGNLKPPLVYFPRCVIYMVKLIGDIKKDGCQIDTSKELDSTHMLSSADFQASDALCHVHDTIIRLSTNYTLEELLRIIFPISIQWVDYLIHLLLFLLSEGVKLWPKLERSSSSGAKPGSSTESENVICHEDEALFGDLFSEGGRSAGSSDGCEQPSVVANPVSVLSNMPIQAATELLSFLRSFIFTPEWCPSLYDDGCNKLSMNHIDALLSIIGYGGCYSDDSGGGTATPEPRRKEQIYDICFELLHSLVTHHALSYALEEYLVQQILKIENGIFVYNDQTLALLAHALISRVGPSGSQLRNKVYMGFIHFIVEKGKSVCLDSPSIKDILECLPSMFHMEILLMAFHLSSVSEKMALADLIFSALKDFDAHLTSFNSTQLSCWALLASRLVVILRHMMFNPASCPASLLVDFKYKLSRSRPAGPHSDDNVKCRLISWASVAVGYAMGLFVKEEPGVSGLLNYLVDFAPLPASIWKSETAVQCLPVSWDNVCSTFSCFLRLWNGKKAITVEDLIVERYLFLLCWDIPNAGLTLDHVLPLWRNNQTLETSNIELFVHFTHLFDGHLRVVSEQVDLFELMIGLLPDLHALLMSGGDFGEFSWDFLRTGQWLSLVLSVLNYGLWQHCIKIGVPGVKQFHMEDTSRDMEFLAFAEGLASRILETNQAALVVKILSSLLVRYIQIYHQAFLSSLYSSQSYSDNSPLLLLKHVGFDECLKEQILAKDGGNHLQLQCVCNILQKLEEVLHIRASGILSTVLSESTFHGFPSHLQTPSGALVSCILSIRGLICVLDLLFKIKDTSGGISVGIEVIRQILNSIMVVKYDRVLENVHAKCEDLCHSLSSGLEGPDYSLLFLLKQIEVFLRDIYPGRSDDCVRVEQLVTKAVDVMDGLYKDPSKSTIFNFYLGAEDVPQLVIDLYGLQRGDFLVLIDSLDNCLSESVNVKVLNFSIDVISGEKFPNLKLEIQKKFLGMDLTHLSEWLEKRLLGSVTEESGGLTSVKESSISLRESTMNFVLCLVSFPDSLSRELLSHLLDAMLISLNTAFRLFDILTAKSYFNFVVQLSRDEASMRSVLQHTVTLMEKLVGQEHLLPGLKFLFNVLEAVLGDCGSFRSSLVGASGKSFSGNSRVGSITSKPAGSRKNSETFVLTANPEGRSTPLECDAMSIDEDEDDGTSDGEVGSIDKDEEEDANSERSLASRVCTFTSSGSNFMEQHWYFCYTCDLTVSKGCCSVCAKVCHRGHRVVYSRSSRFFCDCGAGGVRGSTCQCLEPRKFAGSDSAPIAPVRGSGNFQSLMPLSEDGDQLPDSDSDADEEMLTEIDNSLRLAVPRDMEGITQLYEELDVEGQVLELCSSLLPCVTGRTDGNLSNDKSVILGEDKVLSYGSVLLQLKKAYKSGSLDLKIKAEYSNAKELKSLLANGSLIKSLLSISSRGRLAAGEGDKVAIFDVGHLIGQATITPVTADKTNVKPLSKNIVRFEIVHLAFNPLIENYLAVAGYEDCQVFTVSPRGEVTDRLAIELALQGAYIKRVDWVPGSQVQLMVVTDRFVKIYDLSQDNISPIYYITLPDDTIMDATLVVAFQGSVFLIVLSELGSLYKLELSMEGNVGTKELNEKIQIHGREIHAKGLSLYFSSTYKLVFVSYQDGTTLIGQLNPNAASLTEMSMIYEDEQDGKLRPAGLHHWREILPGNALFVCFSRVKSNAALVVSLGAHEMFAQNIQHAVSSNLPVVGVTAYPSISKDKFHFLVLHDDGSLQIFSHIHSGVDVGANSTSEKVKKLGSNILTNKAYSGANPEFPLDFFEKTVCITPDVKLTGDAIRNSDSEGAKQSLASEDGFLESPSPSGFKITILNSNPDIVMVGLRVHVGNTSANHIPSDVGIFQRVVKLDEGMRCWYDIPFTVAESLLADEEFTITVGPTFNGSALPRIDSLEVYGRPKDEFGWKEKMDAVLDMEAREKNCSMQSAPIQEQVVADGLKLLSMLYLLRWSQGCSKVEDIKPDLDKLRCKQLLETIFESDREPLLQAAACRVLQAVFPKREIYYQVKDSMCLLGVVKSGAVLLSSLGIGGSNTGWIIEEFTAQLRAVSKIALHRRANLAVFLETNGSELVDGLMQVLWGILDIEQLDMQTMNNIVVSSVELIYSYAECLALHGKGASEHTVSGAAVLFKKLLFYPNEAVQTASSLAISSRLLQVPFPKQTMLGTDDVADNATSASVPTHAPSAVGGNAQVMVEEDSITSSVQYCCDGCSTVPIRRRRWHCTVCPDFDLCEACYEGFDADQLPLPHSRDHPMTAIPIEIETFGGEGNEIHFSTDDLNDASVLPAAADTNFQHSTPIHVLEPSESTEFSASLADPVSISASKRAVNSLLLSEILEQLRGWMETTSGVRAIPLMQLFYRLSSAVGGPFVDSLGPESLDLEKLTEWFLDEINPSKPFLARNRSSFGEVSTLVFMFFTLMLRNWHQPGNDTSMPKYSGSGASHAHDKTYTQIPSSAPTAAASSPDDQEKNDSASQLLRACNLLRQQSFVNFLMDILQQLVQVFKSSTANLENSTSFHPSSGCGALLTIRRELPAGNFSPFFSDSYAKAHRNDIFVDYHRLLLENTFRLVYSLVRPEKHDKSGEKEKIYKISPGKDLKLDGYQDVLCSYINNPNTSFVRRYARRLFLHLCGSKSHYYSVRDSWQFSTELKKLHEHVSKSGGFQNPIAYERGVKIVKCLSTVAEVAAARPRNWQKYCLRHGDVLSFLVNWVFYLGEESVIQTLKLLNLAFYTGKDMGHSSQELELGDTGISSNKSVAQAQDSKKKKKSDEGTESGSEKSFLDMEAVVDVFCDKGGDVLMQFIDCFLLEWNSSSVRAEAKCVLYGVWHHGKQSFKGAMLAALLQKVKCLPMYGQNIADYTELLTWLLGKVPDVNKQQSSALLDQCLTPDVIQSMYGTLHSQNELLANHPNSCIYNTLSGLVEFDGFYLESEPCFACSSPEATYSRIKLESLKSETKFTDNRIIVKCTGSYTIQSVMMNVHDSRKSKSVKVLNLYYNNRPVADLSELKNNWSLWKRAKSCHLAFNQTELKVDFPIPITACNFMIELDAFYENLQASSMEPLPCPRCSRPVTDRHGICGSCHENAYQCRQCRNINYENLDSFLCNECGYSKYGRFEFNFMAKPSYMFDNMENDDDMKRGLAAIESESENAHRRYQQLLGFKKPLLKIVSSIGENEMDSQQKDSVQQMMVSLPGPSCKINRKIALLGVLYGEKCKAAFDSVSKSVQTLQGLRRVLMNYLHQKHSDHNKEPSRFVVSRSSNSCYGCATTYVTQCLEILHVLSKHPSSKKQLVAAGILTELFGNNIHQGPKSARVQARAVLCAFSEGDMNAVSELNNLIQKKVLYCLEHHRSMDIAIATREEMLLLSEVCSLSDEFWESRLRIVFQLLFTSIKLGANHPAISEHVILPCLRIVSQACTPPKPETIDKETVGKSAPCTPKDENGSNTTSSLGVLVTENKFAPDLVERNWDGSQKTRDIQLLSYSEWEKGASYIDFVRRQYKVSQAVKGSGQRSWGQRYDYLALKYALRWKRSACRTAKHDLSSFELGSWVSGLILSACSQSIRSEMCMLINLLCAHSSSRRFRLLDLLMTWLPATLSAAESAVEYFDLLFKMIDLEDACLFLTVRGSLTTICKLITQEVSNIESLERALHIDISQGFILHKLIELLGKFLEVPNIRARFMHDNLLAEILEALIVIRGLVVQKTKLIGDCNRLLKDLLDGLLQESSENKRQFIRACICGLQIHGEEKKGQTSLFILEQLCNLICPSKPESVYLLVLNKAHTQEEFIRGSMTKNPYSSAEIGPLMRDVKNKICHQLDLLGLLEDDYGMELLVAGNIISLDLSIAQVYEQVWKKSNTQSSNIAANATMLSSGAAASSRDCPPMIVTYRLQGLDGEATEPMIKELEEDREESQDPEVEFAIAGAIRECGGLEIILDMIKRLQDDLKSNHEQLVAVLNLLLHCCKIRKNRRALLRLGALGLLLETARRAFFVDAMEPAEGILLIVESLTLEANESDSIGIAENGLTVTSEETGAGEQAKKIVLMFLERLCHPSGSKKQHRNTEMVARILPYLTYGEPAAMETLIHHFEPYLQDWGGFDQLQKQHEDNPTDLDIAQEAAKQRFAVENFVRVSESLKTSSCGGRLKDIILDKGITGVAIAYLRETFDVSRQPGYKLPSVPLILSMLRGLSMGHFPTQRCIGEGGILPLLHALEGVFVENEIGARAENLLDMLSDKEGKGDGFLGEEICKLRHATKDEMRRRALRRRGELLQELGMRHELSSNGGERIIVARPNLEGLEDVEEEEDGLACMVCREGYSLRPNDLLGVYSYSKRVNLGVSTSGSTRGECVYTTVSHFNMIHFQCHQEAKRADAALRNPKKEWDGATLRNNETLCNSLFPVRGPSVPVSQYVRYVDQYWENLNALGRADGSRLRLLMYDIVLMLARFATGASFSVDCKGGGKESNSKFLPLMIQMACHLLNQGSPSHRQTMARTVSMYLTSAALDSRPAAAVATQPSPGTEETVQFMMVSSLLSESYESWLQHRHAFLQRGIQHAHMQHSRGRSTPRGSSSPVTLGDASASTTGSSTSGASVSSNDLLLIIQPMLIYTGLIEQLQQFLKIGNPASTAPTSSEEAPRQPEGEEAGSGGGSLEGWELVMKEKLLNVREMVGFSKELLSWLEDITSASNLQEAFDIIGVLADVLSRGFSSCEDFVNAAINTGKS